MLTAYGSIPGALGAVRTGAFDYLTKPFQNEELAGAVKRAVAQGRAERPNRKAGLRAAIIGTMGQGAAIRHLVDQLEAVIATDYSVLFLGETGTGKELVTRAMHAHGPRRTKPFVAVDCGALVDSLVDSELFGHESGAFTGANERRRGRFELAAGGGMLFLDEVGNLSMVAQRTLLRALDDHTVYRVGGSTPINLDLRVVAATNDDLRDRVAAGSFRADLYFRLAEYVVVTPTLRARREDIEFIARRFLAEACAGLGKPLLDIAAPALDLMRDYDWPGNARELRNVMRRAALAASSTVTAQDVARCLGERSPMAIRPPPRGGDVVPLHRGMHDKIREVERGAILDALAQAGGNKAEAARLLGIDYKTFRTKLKAFGGIEPAQRRAPERRVHA